MSADIIDWHDPRPAPPADDVMHVDVGGYEGPLDLLLDLARRQKVDLGAISVLALAEQYIAFIGKVRTMRIEVAADYLVMAAWLTYLKSRLLVPEAPCEDDEPTGDDLAAVLQFRLRRLEAMREAAGALMARPLLGRDIHARGTPEALVVERRSAWQASLFDLLKAYATQRERGLADEYRPPARQLVLPLGEARDILRRLVGAAGGWVALDECLKQYLGEPEAAASVRASSFSASLELVRQGELELRQAAPFAPLLMRRRPGAGEG